MLQDALATASHNPPPTPPSDFPVLLGELTDAISRAQAAAVVQATDRGASSTAVHDARAALFSNHLIPIRAIALGRLTAVSNVGQLFRLPPQGAHKATLVKEARVVAGYAAQYKDVFTASGLPADFVDQLNTAIDTVEQASTVRATARGDGHKATTQLREILVQGKQFVRGLNGIMHAAFAKNPDVLAAWNSARHIRRTSGTSATPTTPQAGTTTTQTAAQPTQPAALTLVPQATTSTPVPVVAAA